jgi:hypothetical protein
MPSTSSSPSWSKSAADGAPESKTTLARAGAISPPERNSTTSALPACAPTSASTTQFGSPAVATQRRVAAQPKPSRPTHQLTCRPSRLNSSTGVLRSAPTLDAADGGRLSHSRTE